MIKELKSYLKYRNRFCGIEQTQIDGCTKCYGAILNKKQKQIHLESNFESNTVEGLKTLIPKNKPIVLVINTDSVLTKQIQTKNKETLRSVHIAFPNIKVEDFYYESITQGENHFISICRKSYVEELLNNYKSNNINVLDFTLGNLISTSIIDFVDFDKIQTSNANISIQNKLITEIRTEVMPSVATYNINGLDITNNQLLSFAAALNLVIKNQNLRSSFVDIKADLNNTFLQKQFASQFLKTGLSTLFLALLINFLFFNHYYNEVNSLRETALVLEASKTRMISLNEKVHKTEKMVADILKSNGSKSSFFVNFIISDLPESILLQELNYQPLLKKIKPDKVIENQKRIILISGKTTNSILFSQWISQIEETSWVASVDILSFEDISKSSSSFNVKIRMKNDTEN
ncbi:hypothetical protein [Winogradskyella sp.]|uniref:hypothetical protein n=1 Tax=Winogradskyella sp. TaxID=1883156 RepID=UPI003AB74244